MLSKVILAALLAAAALGARAQSPAYGLPGTTTGSPVFWPAQAGSPVFGLPSSSAYAQLSAWPMNEGSGTVFHDVSGNSNTETLQAGILTWQSNAGLPGTTALFSATAYAQGSNQTATSFSGATPFSVSAWINLTGVTGTIVSTLDTANNFIGWEFSIQSVGGSPTLHGFLINSYPSNAIEVGSVTEFSPGTLHYVVMTYDGSKAAAGVKFYIDAALSSPSPLDDTLTGSTANTINAALGGRIDGSDPINGVQAFTEIFPTALSQAQISANFAAGPKIN